MIPASWKASDTAATTARYSDAGQKTLTPLGASVTSRGLNAGDNTGGKYNPGTDSWTATGTTNAPDGRFYHTAV